MNETNSAGAPSPDEAFKAIVEHPGMEALVHDAEILETPTPWDAAIDPAETDWNKREELETTLRDTFNQDKNPAVKGQVWELGRQALGHDKRTGDGETAALALQLLARYPNPGDLIKEVVEPSEQQLAALSESDKAHYVDFYTRGAGKAIDRADVHLAQLDDVMRTAANERVLEVLYGDRYAAWKQANTDVPAEREIFADPLGVEHAPVEVKKLTQDEVVELDADQTPLLERETMIAEFGIDGQLLGLVNVGSEGANLSVGIINIKGTDQSNGLNKPFLGESGSEGGFAADYIIMVMEGGTFVGSGAGIRYNEIVRLNRGHGPEGREFSMLEAMMQQAGMKVPETVSRKHCEVTLTKDGRIMIRNLKPTNRTIVETAKNSKHSKRNTNTV